MKHYRFLIHCTAIISLFTVGCAVVSPTGVTQMYGNESASNAPQLSAFERSSNHKSFSGAHAGKTIAIPVMVSVDDATLECTVVKKNILGNPKVVGRFYGGKVVKDLFCSVAKANFRSPVGGELPFAKLNVQILGITAKQEFGASEVEAFVRFLVTLKRSSDGRIGFRGEFTGTGKSKWIEKDRIPCAIRMATESAIDSFLADWSRNGCDQLVAWHDKRKGKEVRPPSLEDIKWEKKSTNIFHGQCVIRCNDYEGFRAREWASAHIFEECRRQLRGMDSDRVIVVYDNETSKFDSSDKTWRISFSTFARTPYIMEFDAMTQSGYITGDLELLGLSKDINSASEKLKKIVLSEMDSRAGAVSSDITKGKALVRFDDFKTDKTYNLITHTFRLVY